MNKNFEKTLKQWTERLEENPRLQIVLIGLALTLVAGIPVWDPLQVLNPPLPVQIVVAEKPIQIDEELLATLVADLGENEAIYISDSGDGAWYCAFAGNTRGYIPVEKQITDRAPLHPYQRICQQPDGRWIGCPGQP